MRIQTALLGAALAAAAAGCQAEPRTAAPGVQHPTGVATTEPALRVVDLTTTPTLEQIIPRLANHRVVFVGESHDRYEHHLAQLAIIRALHQRDPRLAIGLEFFQQPFQSYLDDYVNGVIGEAEMLEGTEYFERWRYDYRLYRPILQYAQEHRIPLVALNVAAELTEKVGSGGLEALSEEERAQLPEEFSPYPEPYEQQLRAVFEQHPPREDRPFEHFLQVQLLWDEGMAVRAADYLSANPGQKMVILAGTGHVQYGAGIPDRLERRLGTPTAVVINGVGRGELNPDIADFVIFPDARELPPPGRLGILMEESDGFVLVDALVDGSAAGEAGLRAGDRLLEVAGRPIGSLAHVHAAMLGREPGEQVQVKVRRNAWFGRGTVEEYAITLK